MIWNGHSTAAVMYLSIRSLSGSIHQDNKSVKCIPPHTPLLYIKTGVYRGITIFLISDLKIDWGYLLVPPQQGGSNMFPQSMF